MQKKIKHGLSQPLSKTRGPGVLRWQDCGCGEGCMDGENDEWGPTVIEAKMAKIGHFTTGPMGIRTWVYKVSGRGFNHCARIGWSG